MWYGEYKYNLDGIHLTYFRLYTVDIYTWFYKLSFYKPQRGHVSSDLESALEDDCPLAVLCSLPEKGDWGD